MISNLIAVTNLGAGASITLPHGLTDAGGAPKAPSTVLPDSTLTQIAVVGTPTATSITFINNGSAPASVNFRVRVEHSIVSAGNDPLIWRGASAGGGGGPSESVLVRANPGTGFASAGNGWWIVSGSASDSGNPCTASSICGGTSFRLPPRVTFRL